MKRDSEKRTIALLEQLLVTIHELLAIDQHEFPTRLLLNTNFRKGLCVAVNRVRAAKQIRRRK